MRWSSDSGAWVLEEIAPETSLDDLRGQTGFAFEVSPDLKPIEALPDAARALLPRLDPLGLRELDFISGRAEQLDAFARVYAAEVDLVGRGHLPPRAFKSQATKTEESDHG